MTCGFWLQLAGGKYAGSSMVGLFDRLGGDEAEAADYLNVVSSLRAAPGQASLTSLTWLRCSPISRPSGQLSWLGSSRPGWGCLVTQTQIIRLYPGRGGNCVAIRIHRYNRAKGYLFRPGTGRSSALGMIVEMHAFRLHTAEAS